MKRKNFAKRICDSCGEETAKSWRKGCKLLCWHCYRKIMSNTQLNKLRKGESKVRKAIISTPL